MRISIIGAGNLGAHLVKGFLTSGSEIVQVFSRDIEKVAGLAHQAGAKPIDNFSNLDKNVDLVILAVHDDVIPEIAGEIRKHLTHQMIVHTAGSVTSLILHHDGNYGVLWPVQSFSKGRAVDWKSIPILITGNNSTALDILTEAAGLLSNKVKVVSDQERIALHLSATIANNFSNHMFAIAEKVVVDNGLDFELLKPLIQETARKVMDLPPAAAQTGPAIRQDEDTMAKHRQLLLENPEIMRLYNAISEHIHSLNQQ